jgi:flagellar motor switch protein FliN/FliY
VKVGNLSQAEIDALFATGGAAESEPPKSAPAAPESGGALAPAPETPAEPAHAQVAPPTFPSLEPTPASPTSPAAIGMLADVDLEVTVNLGQTHRSIREILALGPGSVVQLDRPAGEALDILVNGRLVGKGDVVVIGENFGVRITELLTVSVGRAR